MSFNPFLLAGQVDPFSSLNQARREAAVSELEPVGVWSVLGYAECDQVLKDPVCFSSDGQIGGAESAEASSELGAKGIIGLDPPDHTRLRALLAPAFTARRIASLEARIGVIAAQRLEGAGEGAWELVEELAHPLPLIVIAEILGVPAADLTAFRRWSDALTAARESSEVRRAQAGLVGFFRGQLEERRSGAGNDLLGALQRAASEERLDEEELLAQCVLLLVAGNETTRNLIGNTVLALSRNPDVQARLVERPQELPVAIEEVARLFPPVQCAVRYATRDVCLGGGAIRSGQPLFLWLSAANRDERMFRDPDALQWQRSPNPHLSFGRGPHVCLGAHLGRLEARVAISALLRRFRFHRASEKPPEMLESFMAYGVQRLPLVLEKR